MAKSRVFLNFVLHFRSTRSSWS